MKKWIFFCRKTSAKRHQSTRPLTVRGVSIRGYFCESFFKRRLGAYIRSKTPEWTSVAVSLTSSKTIRSLYQASTFLLLPSRRCCSSLSLSLSSSPSPFKTKATKACRSKSRRKVCFIFSMSRDEVTSRGQQLRNRLIDSSRFMYG